MSRRRLRTVYTSSSSDDEDNPQPQQHENPNHLRPPQQHDELNSISDETMAAQPEAEEEDIEIPSPNPIPNMNSVTLNSTTTTSPAATTAAEPPSVHISDEEFMDISDNLSPLPEVVTASFAASGCPINDHLRRMGLNLKREWLDSCKLGLQNTVPGFSNFDVETKAKLCFGQFLNSDMNYSGAGLLPENVQGLHLVDLTGPFVLQVDEVVNISCPLRDRYKNASSGHKRCLKLSMTDGVQRVFGMEYRPIKSLEALAPAGFKVVIRDVNVRRGILMLVPEVLEILGGSVEELEAARQRLVQEVNKPPRGKRTRNGIIPPLSARATRAAWPLHDASNEAMPLNDANHVPGSSTNSMLHAATQFRENTMGVDLSSRMRQVPLAPRTVTELPSERTDRHSLTRDSAQYNVGRETAQRYNSVEARVLPSSREATEPLNGREFSEHVISREIGRSAINMNAQKFPAVTEGSEQAPAVHPTELNLVSATAVESDDAHMLDYMDHPFILSGEKELPFIYLASLSAKWAAVQGSKPSVRGKIKCLLTGVKRFRYKGRSMFELQVYVEDGSLISEIFIHHNVVQKAIGYSPEEVNAALSSSDDKVVGNIKSTMNQFQLFLMNFEGTMLVEMNETSSFPIALEMNQDCPASDAQLLLKRLLPVSPGSIYQNSQSNVINLSP